MTTQNSNAAGRDPQLWELAKRRASFKANFTAYLVMSVVFWIIWYFTGSQRSGQSLPWPVWPMMGWGIGVFFHYRSAYANPQANPVEKEYEKLVRDQNRG